jgi:REP element-mobilizing transposase RayT
MSDHTHVVISIPPKLSVATVTGQLKGASSHRINEVFVTGQSFAWQAEYGVLSFSEKSLSTIVEYVNNQKKHHAENTLNAVMENFDIAE